MRNEAFQEARARARLRGAGGTESKRAMFFFLPEASEFGASSEWGFRDL